MAILTVHHVTTYKYRRAVAFGEHRVTFRPRDSFGQRLLHAHLGVTPQPSEVRWVLDVFGNCVAVLRFDQNAAKLQFDCVISLDHQPASAFEFPIDETAVDYPFSYDAEEVPDLERFIERRYADPDKVIDRWAQQFLAAQGGTKTCELLAAMTRKIKGGFTYVPRVEMGSQDPLITLQSRSGTCRDFALLMMEAVRSLGMAARFVSGYLHVPGKNPKKRVGGG